MPIPILVPRLGWSMEEGVFSDWLMREGDAVSEGDSLFEMESDKATQEVESFDSGVLRLTDDSPQSGDTVKVGQVLGYLCDKNEEPPSSTDQPKPEPAASATPAEQNGAQEQTAAPQNGHRRDAPAGQREEHRALANGEPQGQPAASPSVRRLARELGVEISSLTVAETGRITPGHVQTVATGGKSITQGATTPQRRVSPRAARAAAVRGVNLAQLTGTGRNGRIRESDVLNAPACVSAQQQPTPTPATREVQPQQCDAPQVAQARADQRPQSHSSLRQAIAARMVAGSQQTAPVTLTAKIDVTSLIELRQQFKQEGDESPPGFTAMYVKLATAALERHPEITQQWTDAGIVLPQSMDIAVAVDTPAGLFAPVVRDTASLRLRDIADDIRHLAEQARARRLTAEAISGAVFTISNLGGYRVEAFTPIINLPQTAILGIGQSVKEPTVIKDEIVVRSRSTLSLTFDHRVIDGAAAARFLTDLSTIVEAPSRWLIA